MGRKKKVTTEDEFGYVDPTYIDLDETKMDTEYLFDDEDDDGYIEPYGWEN